MFKCYDCGESFSEPKIVSERVPYGSSGASFDMSCCPYCKGNFDEAKQCEECNEYYLEEELYNGICVDCLKENFDKPEDLFEFAEEITEENCINQFALDMFGGIEGVNSILKLLLKSIHYCNPEMLQAKKEKFIEKHANELAEYWEAKYGEQSKIF